MHNDLIDNLYRLHLTKLSDLIIYDIGTSDVTLETTKIQVWPTGEQTSVVITFHADEATEEMNESLTLQLAPTPATLLTIPTGEGVFFKQEIPLIIMDAAIINSKFSNQSMNV